MCRDLPEQPESIYAREGTQFHTLCELTARHRLLGGSSMDYTRDYLDWFLETNEEWHEDQLKHVEDWILYLESYLTDESTLLLEERVDTGIPGCWGTADAVIIYEDHVRVIDVKYGAGYKVSATENSQARLYGLGVLNTFTDLADKVESVTNTIWQPRMDNVSQETLSVVDLMRWRDEVRPVAALALTEDAPFGPSEEACRWCPIAGSCAPQMRHMMNQDYGNPDLMTGEEMAAAFLRIPELKEWLTAVEDASLKRAYEEAGSVPGLKVVRSGGRRTILDKDKAIDTLVAAGFRMSTVSNRAIATLGQLDKLVGADKLQEVLGDLLVKSEGRLSLAPDSDPRPPADAVHDAMSDFADISTQGEA